MMLIVCNMRMQYKLLILIWIIYNEAVHNITKHLLCCFAPIDYCYADCIWQGELTKILDLKVPQSRIIYANPCKQASHIKYAAKHDVTLMTFDNETELHKIKAVHPDAKWVAQNFWPSYFDSKIIWTSLFHVRFSWYVNHYYSDRTQRFCDIWCLYTWDILKTVLVGLCCHFIMSRWYNVRSWWWIISLTLMLQGNFS